MAWSRSLRHKCAVAARLSGRDWLDLLRAAVWLVVAELGLGTLGFDRTRSLLARRRAPVPCAANDFERIARLERGVARAARCVWPRPACLGRALVLQRLLAAEGVAASLRFGVRRPDDALRAHAWVEVDGRALGAAPQFLPLLPVSR